MIFCSCIDESNQPTTGGEAKDLAEKGIIDLMLWEVLEGENQMERNGENMSKTNV